MPAPADRLFTIPAGAPFAETLARGLRGLFGAGDGPFAFSDMTIYLPTRRAARSFGETFARIAGGAALLPKFMPLGDVDEDEFLFDPDAEDLDLPPAIAPLRRRLLLATLVRRWHQNRGRELLTFTQAAALAKALAAAMDEIETHHIDLAALDALAPAALAEHWAEVKDFLLLMRDQWPALLEAEGAVNPAARRNLALAALKRRLETAPPAAPVIAAGSTGSIPATAELLGTIARLPKGAVVLPGLDQDLDEESWRRLDPGHPQYGLKQLLERIGVARRDVIAWDASGARERLLTEVLRPAPTTDAWRALAEAGGGDAAEGLRGLSLIEAPDAAGEAQAVALVLREALETKGKTAALVTPDRGLARHVASEMGRFGIALDDSAGRPLAHTAPGAFLCLTAEAADADFAPVPLLALLKHPLAMMGDAALFRRRARLLDMRLRGPRPDAGLAGVARVLAEAPEDLRAWFAQIAAVLEPLARALAGPEIDLAATLDAHIAAAEALATDRDGAVRLWDGDAGEAARMFVGALADASAGLLPIEARSYAALFRTLAMEKAVRPAYGLHPRLAILGPLEARLQRFDLVVLGGLNEGAWPRAAANDPWFSRPMRRTLGLEQPERTIGLAAHDFATLAAAPEAVLTRAQKADGAPAVASRWVLRLQQLAQGLGLRDALAPGLPYAAIAAALGDPGAPAPAARPAPRPPVAARPRKLSVTEIEKWIRDPYAIYARRVLDLKPLDPLEAEIGPLERGSAVHAALERFVREFPRDVPPDAAAQLIAIMDAVFAESRVPRAALALWRPRFILAAHWFVAEERARRAAIAESFVEVEGERLFAGPAGAFTLHGRADRIDRLKAGGAAILDYKTGAPPSDKQVKAHLAPQLPLEGAILAAGGFKALGACDPAAFVYVRFGGTAEPVRFRSVDADAAALAAEAAARLEQRIARFDDQAMPYLSRVMPEKTTYEGDYDHLARVREWLLASAEEDE